LEEGVMRSKENLWSPEEEQTLIDLKYEGKSYLEISEIMNRTPDSLRKKHWLLMREAGTPQFWQKVNYLVENGILAS
jgi:hypothetical protein